MVASDSKHIAAPPGLRTPSPTKSRLPIGSSLPQRSASVKGLSNISLQPTVRKSSLRAPGTARKSTLSQATLQSHPTRLENQRPPRLEKTKVDTSTNVSHKSSQPETQQKIISLKAKESPAAPVQPLTFSRATLDDRLELLHLHAIHSQASETQAQWENHAFQTYQKQFQALQDRSQEVNQLEMDRSIQRNASTIMSWSKPGNCLSQLIQTLSKVISEVDQLTSANGRYSLAIQAFEHWSATNTNQQDRQIKIVTKAKSSTIEDLGDGWLSEIEALQWQVVTLADQMLQLQVTKPNGSDLERVVTTVSEMLKNMLEELEMVEELESALRQDGQDRTDGSIAILAEELDKDLHLN